MTDKVHYNNVMIGAGELLQIKYTIELDIRSRCTVTDKVHYKNEIMGAGALLQIKYILKMR